MIFETIITSMNDQGEVHVAPFGIQRLDETVVISPYKPSLTLSNILASQRAVLSLCDDVRVFAGALTNRQPWELVPAEHILGYRLMGCLAHEELTLLRVEDDAVRPRLHMQVQHRVQHQAFAGFNRAQAAVIELAVLVSRLNRLAKDKVQSERQYLQIAIDKTAGERELQAWGWLTDKIDSHYAAQDGSNVA
jgi:hypothetical protein